jgi:hypothetical protein
VQLLAESPARLRLYIDNLASASNDPLADLQKKFPQLASKDVENVWKSQIASVKGSGRTDLRTFSQTNEKLDALLGTKFSTAEESSSLEDLCKKKIGAPDQKLALKKFGEDLLLLAARANPALRPVIQDYQKCAAELMLGKNRGVAAKLTDLKTLRKNFPRA